MSMSKTSAHPWKKDIYSLISIFAVNLLPFFFVSYGIWNLYAVAYYFTMETVVIFIYIVAKLILIYRDSVKVAEETLKLIIFFGFVLAIPTALLLYFLLQMHGNTSPNLPIKVALISMLISHGISFHFNFVKKKEYIQYREKMMQGKGFLLLTGRVLLRVAPILIIVPIIIFLAAQTIPGQNSVILFSLLLFIGLKSLGDVYAHQWEHSLKFN